MILAGDIGGTSTRIALAHVEGRTLSLDPVERYASREHPGLGEIVSDFLARHPAPVDRACFGIAGPVRSGRVETPNLPWIIEAAALSRVLRSAPVKLINDLEANAYGVFTLGPDDFEVLNAGDPAPDGNAAILSAGTGLGEAGYHGDGRELHPFASEGGHADFAARSDLEIELFRWLLPRFGGHVSYERVLSGPGLVNVYTFLRDTGRGEEPSKLSEEMRTGDPAAAISTAALRATSPLAVAALDLFVSILGAEAGNLALKMKATRGIYLGGGIAPKILPRLKRSGFLEAFVDKGRFRAFMEAIPVKVILNEHTALRGAALCASLPA